MLFQRGFPSFQHSCSIVTQRSPANLSIQKSISTFFQYIWSYLLTVAFNKLFSFHHFRSQTPAFTCFRLLSFYYMSFIGNFTRLLRTVAFSGSYNRCIIFWNNSNAYDISCFLFSYIFSTKKLSKWQFTCSLDIFFYLNW